jgi:hypothetical protein
MGAGAKPVRSPQCAKQEGTIMDRAWFDRMARRQALRRIGGGLAGGALAALGLRQASVAAQREPMGPTCQRCIAEFYGQCVSSCVRTFPDQAETCAAACHDGLILTCTILGYDCTPEHP